MVAPKKMGSEPRTICTDQNPFSWERGTEKREGAVAVEFALVGSFLIMVLFALIEFGRAFMVVALLNNAAEMGCRTGILPGKTNDNVTTAVDNFTKATGLSAATPTITVNGVSGTDVSSANPGDTISVTLTIPVSSQTWLPVPQWLSGNLTGQCTLNHE